MWDAPPVRTHPDDAVGDHPGLWVDVLGPLDVWAEGRRVAMSGGKSAVLLATLAMSAGQPVTVEMLADRLWHEELPERVRGSLHTHVLRLRRTLGADSIRTLPSGYMLDIEPDRVDVLRFRRLVTEAASAGDATRTRQLLDQALQIWRGEPLSGLASTAFEHQEVPRLQDERLAALLRRVDLDLAAGRHADLAGELRDEVGRRPLSEPLWHRLITALAVSGRRAEAIEAYHDVRGQLRAELAVEPSEELQRLFRRLLAGDVARTDAAAPPVPMQQPAGVDRFTGRRQELAALDELLARRPPDPAMSLVVALVGGAGTGKTALAVRWSHRVGARFPGGRLHVDLRGYDAAAPTDPATALDALLRDLGTPAEQVPPGLDARAALFRTVTTGRGLLLVADNARDSDHVRPLLPGPGNLVIATSRSQLRGLIARDGAHRLPVGPLAAADAVALLDRVVGADRCAAEPAAVRDLAERCDRLPLALLIAAERLTRLPHLPVADLAEELRDERSRIDALSTGEDAASDVRAVLSWSYRRLPPDAARAFRLLGLHPGGAGWSLAAAAALLDVRPQLARNHLDRLVALHLLEQPRPDHYALPGLVRAYAAGRAREEEPAAEREAAETRLLDWCRHAAVTAPAGAAVAPAAATAWTWPPGAAGRRRSACGATAAGDGPARRRLPAGTEPGTR